MIPFVLLEFNISDGNKRVQNAAHTVRMSRVSNKRMVPSCPKEMLIQKASVT